MSSEAFNMINSRIMLLIRYIHALLHAVMFWVLQHRLIWILELKYIIYTVKIYILAVIWALIYLVSILSIKNDQTRQEDACLEGLMPVWANSMHSLTYILHDDPTHNPIIQMINSKFWSVEDVKLKNEDQFDVPNKGIQNFFYLLSRIVICRTSSFLFINIHMVNS
jgi:hypothetical protein